MRAARHHVESLDAFRGLTIAGMILVNNPGNWNAVFAPLLHADWNGCTLADLVFPFFLFIMGAALPFALSRRAAAGHARRDIYRRVARRTIVLIALGLVLNVAAAVPALQHIRFPGVLQRIAIVYFAAALITMHVGVRGRVVIAGGLTLGHWAILAWVPSAGAAAGVLTPEHNIAAAIDQAVFGAHLLTPWGDPEGLLGTLSSLTTALLGTVAGAWIRETPDDRRRVAGLTVAGVVALVIGMVWARALPLNKSLWTGSYALVTAGLASIAFAVCYLAIDVADVRGWARPFVWMGVNPLALYFLSELVSHALDWPIGGMTIKSSLVYSVLDPAFGSWLPDPIVSLLFAIGFVTVWLIVAAVFYRRGFRLQA